MKFAGSGLRTKGESHTDWTNVVGGNDGAALPGQTNSRLSARGPRASTDRLRSSVNSRLSSYEIGQRMSDLKMGVVSTFPPTNWRGSRQGDTRSMNGSPAESPLLGLDHSRESVMSFRSRCNSSLLSSPSASPRHSNATSHSPSPRGSQQIGADSSFKDKVMEQMVSLGFCLANEHELILREHMSRLEHECALLRKAVLRGSTTSKNGSILGHSVSRHEAPGVLNGVADKLDGDACSAGHARPSAHDAADDAERSFTLAGSNASAGFSLATSSGSAGPPETGCSSSSISIPIELNIGGGGHLDPVEEETQQQSKSMEGCSSPSANAQKSENQMLEMACVKSEPPMACSANGANGETEAPANADVGAETINRRTITIAHQASASVVHATQRARFSTQAQSFSRASNERRNMDSQASAHSVTCTVVGESEATEQTWSEQSSESSKTGKKVMFGDLGLEEDSEKLDVTNPDLRFPMWDIWVEKQNKDSIFARASLRRASEARTCSFGDDDEDSDDSTMKEKPKTEQAPQKKTLQQRKKECQRRLVAHPNSGGRMCWELFGCFFVCFESVTIPTQFLDLPPNDFMPVLGWVVRIFWSVDLPASFLVGYRRGVHTEMRPGRIAINYLKTWFFLDVCILAADWMDAFMASESMDTVSMGRTLKITRLVRMVRLLRLLRLQRVPDFALAKSIAFYFRSEFTHIFLGILKIMIFFMWVNHVIACLWYALARSSEPNWMQKVGMEGDEDMAYKYATSFHWSLTQFTGSMEVNPANLSERWYAVAILLMAFFISASVVSAITSMMTRLEIATAQESERFTMLKQYLFDNHITSKVALRVERNAQHALAERKRNTPEASIELLQVVSEPLRVEIHFEINMPVLAYHPFFRNYSLTSPSTMRQVCHNCVARLTLSRSDVLFRAGEVAVRMFFVVSGRLHYVRNESLSTSVGVGDWACEAIIWTPWANVGTLRVKSDCTLAMFDVERFQQLALQYDMDGFAKKYGERFLRYLNQTPVEDLTDLEDPNMDAQDLADITCPPPNTVDQTLMSRLNGMFQRHSKKRSQHGGEENWFKPHSALSHYSKAGGRRSTFSSKRSRIRDTEINIEAMNQKWKQTSFGKIGSLKFGWKGSRDPGSPTQQNKDT